MERKLINYLPHVVRDYAEFQGIMQAEQPEFEKAWAAAEQLLQNQFISQAGEVGLSRWEKILGITPKGTDTLETRRQRILTKYLSRLPYTYRSLLQYLQQVTQGFTLSMDAYTLYLEVTLAGYEQKTALLAALMDMLPANLILQLKAAILQDTAKAPVTAVSGLLGQVTHICRPNGASPEQPALKAKRRSIKGENLVPNRGEELSIRRTNGLSLEKRRNANGKL